MCVFFYLIVWVKTEFSFLQEIWEHKQMHTSDNKALKAPMENEQI